MTDESRSIDVSQGRLPHQRTPGLASSDNGLMISDRPLPAKRARHVEHVPTARMPPPPAVPASVAGHGMRPPAILDSIANALPLGRRQFSPAISELPLTIAVELAIATEIILDTLPLIGRQAAINLPAFPDEFAAIG